MAADLHAFAGRHPDSTIVVCGCGPSLNDLPDPRGLLTIGVNDVGRLFDPTWLVVVNPPNQFTADRFRHVQASRAQALFTQLDLGPVQPPVVRFRLGKFGGTDDAGGDTLDYTQNSPYVAVCLAARMGARRIGLIGVDFVDDHFFARTGRHALAPRLREIDEQYGRLAAALRGRGVELVNLSARSRLQSLARVGVDWAARGDVAPIGAGAIATAGGETPLRIVSYATTPVAGVPAILARCIAHATPHAARCVWAADGYGNGVVFDGDVNWARAPAQATALLAEADVVIVHNGKVDPSHRRLLAGKRVVTMAHNYGWNVDMQFVGQGQPGVVVGQYQATLPEFAGWQVIPNPVPLWEPAFSPEAKGDGIVIAYTPSGRHERYPAGHRLFWHAKGYETTMRALDRLAGRPGVSVLSTRQGEVSHAQSLAMKRAAHLVIDECATGSYHRNSLEGLAAGCVVVNGLGLLPGVEDALARCAPGAPPAPFVRCGLAALPATLAALVDQGPQALQAAGALNRAWMEKHWQFGDQWAAFWRAACKPAPRPAALPAPSAARAIARQPARPSVVRLAKGTAMTTDNSTAESVSVVIPHGGRERLPHLAAVLATLRQRAGIAEVVVVELGTVPLAVDLARRWQVAHLFVRHDGAFERARALNAALPVARGRLLLWLDNDLLPPYDFVPRAAQELQARGLDVLLPYTTVRYLREPDSSAVMRGAADPQQCAPRNVMASATSASGGACLVRRDFLERHGGLVEGFVGWGGEDNAWVHKASLLGRFARTSRGDQHLVHLHHARSNGTEQGSAAAANPHYAANVALMQQVRGTRDVARFVRDFPATPPAAGELVRFDAVADPSTSADLPVWTYWEGPLPDWIADCQASIVAAAPHARVLTPESFDKLWDADRDIDLSHLQPAHRADFIRAFLLQRHGGLWVDADCLVMQPLKPVLALLAAHDFVGHRERSGLVSNGFIGARRGSRIAASFYERVSRRLRQPGALGWTTIGSEPLNAVLAEQPQAWHELPCERVQPVCWSTPEKFFARAGAEMHGRNFDENALCYMLSNTSVKRHLTTHPGARLDAADTFFSYVRERSMRPKIAPSPAADNAYVRTFAAHAAIYARHRLESASGPGSSLAQTGELRERLPLALQHLGIESLLDAPCGDFNWMRHVATGVASYVGIDVNARTIADLQRAHGSPRRRFVACDLTRDALPRADAIFCRDLLPHLSFAEIARVLANFRRSGARWLLTTTFTGARPNVDTSDCNWRTLNLTLAPFGFPAPALLLDERCSEVGGAYRDKSIAAWRLDELPIRAAAEREPASMTEGAGVDHEA